MFHFPFWIDQGFQFGYLALYKMGRVGERAGQGNTTSEEERKKGKKEKKSSSLYSSKTQHETVKSTWVTTTVANREREREPREFPPLLETLSKQLEQYWLGVSMWESSRLHYAPAVRKRSLCIVWAGGCQFAPCPMICCQTRTIYDRQRALFLHPPLVDAKSATPSLSPAQRKASAEKKK